MFRPFVLAMLLAAASHSTAHAFAPCPTGNSEMSVEAVNGIFCVPGSRICIASINDGSCPGPQTGLPNGSYCGVVASGVYGCKTNTTPAPPVTTAPPPAPVRTPTTQAPVTSAPALVSTSEPASNNNNNNNNNNNSSNINASRCPGGYEMSVEGVPGIFCVAQGPICIADRATGTCPGVQPGLPNGSHCGKVASGVFGCTTNASGSADQPSSTPVPEPSQTLAAAPVSTSVSTAAPAATATAAPDQSSRTGNCPTGHSEMSVEGVPGVFCLSTGPICMADSGTGACPQAQSGLPNGSYCGKVASGVYGCKTGAADTYTFAPADVVGQAPVPAPTTPSVPAAGSTPASTTSTLTTTPMATDGSQCAEGEYDMSVEGVRGVFCLSKGPICIAEVSSGTCPGPQFGLPNGSFCGKVASGVYGCKLNSGVLTGAPISTTSAPTLPAATTLAPVVPASTTTPTPTTSAPTAKTSSPTPAAAGPGGVCAAGATPMSIEGVATIFCVDEPACADRRNTGNCPNAQSSLPFGSYCDIITKTGIYGCKPRSGAPTLRM